MCVRGEEIMVYCSSSEKKRRPDPLSQTISWSTIKYLGQYVVFHCTMLLMAIIHISSHQLPLAVSRENTLISLLPFSWCRGSGTAGKVAFFKFEVGDVWTPWERSRRRQTCSRQLTGAEQSRAEKVWDDRWSQAAVASQLISCEELHRDTQAERPRRRRAGGQTDRQIDGLMLW